MTQLSGSVLLSEVDSDTSGLRRTLEQAGLTVVEESTGEALLARATRERPDVVILDTDSPDVMAFVVCRVLRESYGQLLPIILTSATRTETTDRIAGLLLGADDYMIRPYDLAELLARVRRSLDRSHAKTLNTSDRESVDDFNLTPREQEVLDLLLSGLNQAQIAAELVISPNTVATHIQRILLKMGVHNRAQAVAKAAREGWTPSSEFADRSQPAPLAVVEEDPVTTSGRVTPRFSQAPPAARG